MNIEVTRIALIGLPESDRLALLQLPIGASADDAARAITERARADEVRGRSTVADLAQLPDDTQRTMARAAFDAAENGLNSLAVVLPNHVQALDDAALAAAAASTPLAIEEESFSLELRDLDLKLAEFAREGDPARERTRVRTSYAGAALCGLVEVGFAGVLASKLTALDRYPSFDYVPGATWWDFGLTTMVIVVPIVLAPGLILAVSDRYMWAPWVSRAAIGGVITLGLIGLGSIVALRAAVALHAGNDVADLVISVASAAGICLMTAAVFTLHRRARDADRRLERLESNRAEHEKRRQDLLSRNAALCTRRAQVEEAKLAPSKARVAFEGAVMAARDRLKGESRRVEERVRAAVAVYAQMRELSPAGRAHLSTIFRIIDRDDAKSSRVGEA